MSILVYALHYEGEFNKNSLGAVSEGARLAGEVGGECAAGREGHGRGNDGMAQRERAEAKPVVVS